MQAPAITAVEVTVEVGLPLHPHHLRQTQEEYFPLEHINQLIKETPMATKDQIIAEFQRIVGRNPTRDELAEITAALTGKAPATQRGGGSGSMRTMTAQEAYGLGPGPQWVGTRMSGTLMPETKRRGGGTLPGVALFIKALEREAKQREKAMKAAAVKEQKRQKLERNLKKKQAGYMVKARSENMALAEKLRKQLDNKRLSEEYYKDVKYSLDGFPPGLREIDEEKAKAANDAEGLAKINRFRDQYLQSISGKPGDYRTSDYEDRILADKYRAEDRPELDALNEELNTFRKPNTKTKSGKPNWGRITVEEDRDGSKYAKGSEFWVDNNGNMVRRIPLMRDDEGNIQYEVSKKPVGGKWKPTGTMTGDDQSTFVPDKGKRTPEEPKRKPEKEPDMKETWVEIPEPVAMWDPVDEIPGMQPSVVEKKPAGTLVPQSYEYTEAPPEETIDYWGGPGTPYAPNENSRRLALPDPKEDVQDVADYYANERIGNDGFMLSGALDPRRIKEWWDEYTRYAQDSAF